MGLLSHNNKPHLFIDKCQNPIFCDKCLVKCLVKCLFYYDNCQCPFPMTTCNAPFLRQLPMPLSYDNCQCPFPMTTVNAPFLWQLRMPLSYDNCQCPFPMTTANALFLWQLRMPLSYDNCQCPFPMITAKAISYDNCECLFPMPTVQDPFPVTKNNVLFIWQLQRPISNYNCQGPFLRQLQMPVSYDTWLWHFPMTTANQLLSL